MKAIILSRVSTFEQSLDAQTLDLQNDAKFNGYNKIITIEDKESAIKLSEEERNGLNVMKYNIEHDSSIKAVFIWEITRLSRQLPMLYSLRDYFQQHKIQLYCHTPQFKLFNDDWTVSDTSNMVFAMFAVLAENEMKVKKQRFARAIAKKKSEHKFLGGFVNFGYAVNNEGYYILGDTAIVVRNIFKKYASGKYSLNTLTKELFDEGVLKNRTYEAAFSKVYAVLHNEIYLGNEKFPKIINQELWDKCHEILKANKSYDKKDNHTKALLRGLLFDVNGEKFSCDVNRLQRYFTRKSHITISFKYIDDTIFDYAYTLYNKYNKDTEKQLNDINIKIQLLTRKVATYGKRANELQDKLDRIEERYIDGKISDKKRDALERDTLNALKETNLTIKSFNEEIDRYNKHSNDIYNKRNINTNDMTIDDKIEIVRNSIKKIIIEKTKRTQGKFIIYNMYNDKIKEIEYSSR